MLNGLTVAGSSLALVAAFARLTFGGFGWPDAALGVAVIAALSTPALLRRGRLSADTALKMFVWLGSAAAVMAATLHGGTTAIVLAWLPVGLIIAGLRGDARTLWQLAVADLLAIAALAAAGSIDLLPPPPTGLIAHNTINLLAMVAAVGAGVGVFVRQRERERTRREQTRDWFELLATEARVGVLIVEGERVRFANPMARRLFSLPGALESAPLPASLVLPGDKDVSEQTVLVDGDIRWLEVHRTHPEGLSSRLHLLTVFDVSDRRAEERLRIREEAEAARRQHLSQLGALAGGLAHDLNNLLAAIASNAEMLGELDEPDLRDEALGDIRAATVQATDIIRQLLAFAGRGQVLRRRLDLGAVMQNTVRISRNEAQRRGVRLEVSAGGGPIPLDGDETELRQVIGNLVSNALRATPEDGSVRVGVAVRDLDGPTLARAQVRSPSASPGRFAWITVEDTGCGIDDAHHGRVFEPLFTTRSEGRGLGLAAVRGIVERGGGALFLTSEPRSGTRFEVAIPAAPEAELSPDPTRFTPFEETTRTPSRPVAVAPPRAQGQRILVLDDEPLVRTLLVRLLTKAGFQAIAAADITEAQRVVTEHPVDAAIIDFLMPEITGDVALERLRQLQPGLPAVLCSGYISSSQHDVTRPFAAVVSKPFTERQLVEAVASTLQAPPQA